MTEATEAVLPRRRRVAANEPRRYQVSMRNDFLTPRGTPYKWQEVGAELHREVTGVGTTVVLPVSYQWQRVGSRTGTPDSATENRDWAFARGQSFRSMLLHTDLVGERETPGEPASATIDVSYPTLPKAPAVDLLVVLSWDIMTFEVMVTQVIATLSLREVGNTAELRNISDTWANLTFSDPSAVAVFRNAVYTARHLGFGRVAGRSTAVYSIQCLDCKLDYESGPMTQRGRSSFWITLQLDLETGDLVSADMTEMIIATTSGSDGKSVPVQKRRQVHLDLVAESAPIENGSSDEGEADPDGAAEAMRLAERVADYVRWQTASLERLPQGAAELAMMGFRSTVGTDSAGVYRQVKALRTDLQAVLDGEAGATTKVRATLPEHRQQLEGLLAFGQISVDEAARLGVQDERRRVALGNYTGSVRGDLIRLLELFDQLEGRPA